MLHGASILHIFVDFMGEKLQLLVMYEKYIYNKTLRAVKTAKLLKWKMNILHEEQSNLNWVTELMSEIKVFNAKIITGFVLSIYHHVN